MAGLEILIVELKVGLGAENKAWPDTVLPYRVLGTLVAPAA